MELNYLKLIISMVSNGDTETVMNALSKNGYFATKVGTKGQFLADGHTTLLIGSKPEEVENIIEIIKNSVTKRTVVSNGVDSTLTGTLLQAPVEVETGGAVVFVIDVEQFEKI